MCFPTLASVNARDHTRVMRMLITCPKRGRLLKMAAFGRGAKLLMLALFISVCILLHLESRVSTLMLEADEARLLAENAIRERDRVKSRIRNRDTEVPKEVEFPRVAQEKKEPDPLPRRRIAAVAPTGEDDTQIMNERFKYQFKVCPYCDRHFSDV